MLNRAIFHDRNTVSQTQGLVKIMGNENDGLVEHLLQAQEFVLHFTADQRIQRRERFIQKPDVGFNRKGAGNANPLLLSAGQFAGEILFAPLKSHQLDDLKRTGAALVLVLSPHLKGEGDVIKNGAVRQQAETLKHHAHLVAAQLDQLFLGQLHDVLTVDLNDAAGDVMQTRKTPDQCRFPRAGQPHDNQHFAFVDFNRNIPDAGNIAVRTDVIEAVALWHLLEIPNWIRAENLPDVFAGNDRCGAHDVGLSWSKLI